MHLTNKLHLLAIASTLTCERAAHHIGNPLTPIAWRVYRPKMLAETIQKDRARGPSTPSKLLSKLDVSENEGLGMLAIHTHRRGAPVTRLKLLYLRGSAYVLELPEVQWSLIAGPLDRVDAEPIAPIYPLAPKRVGISRCRR